MPFVPQPQTEGIQRLDVGVARHWLDAALPQGDHKSVERCFRQDRRRVTVRLLKRLKGRLIPLNSARGDVLQVAALGEKLVEQRGRRQRVHRAPSPLSFFWFFSSNRSVGTIWCAQQDSNLRPPGS